MKNNGVIVTTVSKVNRWKKLSQIELKKFWCITRGRVVYQMRTLKGQMVILECWTVCILIRLLTAF